MKRSKVKWESSIRVKEDTEELELTSGGREFHRRHDEGMKEERYREEEQAGSSTVPVLRRLYSHRLFRDFGMQWKKDFCARFSKGKRWESVLNPGVVSSYLGSVQVSEKWHHVAQLPCQWEELRSIRKRSLSNSMHTPSLPRTSAFLLSSISSLGRPYA